MAGRRDNKEPSFSPIIACVCFSLFSYVHDASMIDSYGMFHGICNLVGAEGRAITSVGGTGTGRRGRNRKNTAQSIQLDQQLVFCKRKMHLSDMANEGGRAGSPPGRPTS
jgi:hypothetical protein